MSAVSVRAMSDEEFATFREHAVREWAAVHVNAGNWSVEEAQTRAERETDELLSQGAATAGVLLLVAEVDTRGVVGYAWVALEREGERGAWIYDIEIEEQHRGRGYGRALLAAVEDQVHSRGIGFLGLNVFADNAVARALYESCGYVETSLHMCKELG